MQLCVLAINVEDFIVVNFKEIYKKKKVNFFLSTLPTLDLKTEESGTSPNSFKVSWRENVKFPTSNPDPSKSSTKKTNPGSPWSPSPSREAAVAGGRDGCHSELPPRGQSTQGQPPLSLPLAQHNAEEQAYLPG